MKKVLQVLRTLPDGNPWGLIVFLTIATLGAVGGLVFHKLTLADYLGVVAASGGLLGLGHSIHHSAKHLAESRWGEKPSRPE
jgi:hypothetical protein